MTDPKLLDRIRKLLALGQSPNPHEAAAAIERAQRLMAEHGLCEDDIDVAEIEIHGCNDSAMSRAKSVPAYETMLANMVKDVFGVEAVLQQRPGPRISFYGPVPRAEIAAHCFVVLLRKLTQARLEYMVGGFSLHDQRTLISRGDNFAEGWVAAVALIVRRVFLTDRESAAIAVWERKHFGRLVVVTARGARPVRGAADARAAGWEAGERVDLFRSMSGGRRQQMFGGRG